MNKQKYFKNNTVISALIECMFIVYFAVLIPASVLALETKASFVDSTHPGSFAGLVKKARPSVVNISTVKIIKSREKTPLPSDPFKDFFDRFFGDRLPKAFKQHSLGTGFIKFWG
jgi:serine protease Do